ncbi:MAG TPA: hypothetical protein VLY85_03890 [Thermoplasmata archaeon]|nr:hypothetical protein [Thermoplasmata archaeon]
MDPPAKPKSADVAAKSSTWAGLVTGFRHRSIRVGYHCPACSRTFPRMAAWDNHVRLEHSS